METAEYDRIAAAEDGHWWYRATRSLMSDLLERHLGTGQRILDAGCGPGGNGAWLASHGRVVGLDVAPEAVAYVRDRRPSTVPVRGSVSALPFGPSTFDVAVVITVVNIVADDSVALRDLTLVLRPGGALLLIEPAFPSLRRGHDAVVHTRRRYRKSQLTRLVEAAGLQIERATYAHAPLVPAAAALSLWERARRRQAETPTSDLERGGGLDRLFAGLALLERRLLRRLDLPIGLSVAVVATKPHH